MLARIAALVLACVSLSATVAVAQTTRIMLLGDSITQGGQTYVSYRYQLWFDLQLASYDVDFVGRQTLLNAGSTPNPAWYPDYGTFDPDHEGYWGWRTDEIATIVTDATQQTMPDIVLIHLGTNDIGQQGASGVTNADINLRLILDRIRAEQPSVTILLAQVIDIGPGSGYGPNADQVAPLNAVIATIAAEETTAQSPILLIDQNTGFDITTMLQSDDLHPNLGGEAQMAGTWLATLSTLLTAGNPPPVVDITAPLPGSSFVAPANILITADASDPNGSISRVRFFEGTNLLDTDTLTPFEFDWTAVTPGSYSLTAEATDDQGSIRTSSPVSVTVVPAGGGVPILVLNPSFEDPPLDDQALISGPGVIGNWTFTATPNTFLGIFNPPAGSYSTAGGNGTPTGADGANAAYLFNDGGPAEMVEATQQLGETLLAGIEYVLTVAIGKFLPDQPFVFSTYGGYTIELLAGSTVIASDTDSVDPPFDQFQDAFAMVSSSNLDPALLGQPLSVRLGISATDASRSTHFDNVRLTRRDLVTATPPLARGLVLSVWPNPFNPRSTIEYTIPEAAIVSLTLYDLAGRRVAELVPAREMSAGTHRISASPSVASGVYLLRLRADGRVITRKLVLLE